LPPRDDKALSTTGAYGLVRHPIYLGWALIVWSVPAMTGTRLVFAAVSTLYLVVAIPFEERQMRRTMGRPYDDYARAVRWRMLPGVY
jgi:protein-S-isoprenylcysteine O-methyltransferase Ste14